MSLKVAKVTRFVSLASGGGRYGGRATKRKHEWQTWPLTFDLAYFRYSEITWAPSGFLGIRSFRTFWHSTHARTLVGVHTLWISLVGPIARAFSSAYFHVCSFPVRKSSTVIDSRRMIFRFVESRVSLNAFPRARTHRDFSNLDFYAYLLL